MITLKVYPLLTWRH